MSGQEVKRANILGITNADPCVVTTDDPHDFTSGLFVRLTDLNGAMPDPRGQDPLNNGRYKITVTDTDKFYLRDPITFKKIDSTNYPPYVEGGFATVIQQEFFYSGES